MTGALNSLYKAEIVRSKNPWTGIRELEIATAEESTGATSAVPMESCTTAPPAEIATGDCVPLINPRQHYLRPAGPAPTKLDA